MKPWKYLIVSLLFCFAAIASQAQARKISLNFVTPFPSTIDSNQAALAIIRVLNVDTGDYAGIYTFRYTINGSLNTANDTSGFQEIPKFVSIASGDTLLDTLIIHPTLPAFMSGPSVVVIWPMATSGDDIAVVDSLKFSIDVHHTGTGIGEITEGALYYANDRIILRETDKNRLIQVRIVNTIGSEVYYTEESHTQYIELPDLPAGMYIAEAILSNNRRAILKFIKPLH